MVTKVEQRYGPAVGKRGGSWVAYKSIIFTLLACVASLAAVYLALHGTDLGAIVVPLSLLLAVGLLFLAVKHWEAGLQAILVVVIMEGAIRKWFLPSYGELVYFYKDGLMIAVMVGYWIQRRKAAFVIKRQLTPLFQVMAVFVLFALGVVANPKSPHILISLFGIKAYCLYMPLVFLVPRMFPTKEKLVGFLRWYLVIALMVAALGAWQFLDGDRDSPLNRYAFSESAAAGGPQATALFSDAAGNYFVRITSTFSFVSGLTVYLPAVFALLLGLTSLGSSQVLPFKVRLIYYLVVAAVVATAFMTGSRAVIVNLAVVGVAFFAFVSMKTAFRRLRQLIVIGGLVFLTVTIVAPQAVGGLYERAFGGESQMEEGSGRIEEVFSLPFAEGEYAGAFGYGIGATQNSVPALMSRLDLTNRGERISIPLESEPGRVMVELGVVGFLLFTLMRIVILVTVLRACIVIRDSELKALAVAGFAGVVFPLLVGGAVVNHTQNVYQWFLIGMVFALLNADQLSRARLGAVENAIRLPLVNRPIYSRFPVLNR
ncbi:MAG: hypothetical protein QOG23_3541 [Blastocatellia bacterium]|jgi:hypothetical protein|nr:hypothetical protein [Blastocatellia bacterium]